MRWLNHRQHITVYSQKYKRCEEPRELTKPVDLNSLKFELNNLINFMKFINMKKVIPSWDDHLVAEKWSGSKCLKQTGSYVEGLFFMEAQSCIPDLPISNLL